MLKFIKNLFNRKKSENSKLADKTNNSIEKEIYRQPKKIGVTSKSTTRDRKMDLSGNSYGVNQTGNPDFVTSMLIANATDSALIGTVIGGDPVGAIIGDLMNDSNSHNDSNYSSHSDYSSYSSDSSSYSSDSSSYSSDSSSYSSDSFSGD